MGPNDPVGWTSSPDRRGTIDILWICAFTLFICTWTVLHPNIPTQDELLAGWTQWLFWRKRLKLAGLMALMVAAPELVVALAARDWLWARASVREMRGLGFDDRRWSMSHAFFANMGGVVLYFKIPDQEEGDAGTSGEGDKSKEKPGPLGQNGIQQAGLVRHSLCAARLAMLVREPYELQLPHLTKEELRDRSKSNTLAKLLACMQAGWLVVQCFARVNQHLAISQLEVATAGFVGCTVMTYLFWLSKPRNVESTVAIQCPHELQSQVLELLDRLAIRDSQEAVGDFVQNMGRMPFLTFMNPEGRTTTRMFDIIALVFAAAGLCLSFM